MEETLTTTHGRPWLGAAGRFGDAANSRAAGAPLCSPGRRPRGIEARATGVRRWIVFRNGLAGFAFGLLVLHPIARVICRLLDPSVAPTAEIAQGHPLLQPIGRSFEPELLPMGIVFALLCAIAAVVIGHHRELLVAQGAELRRKTEALRGQNRRLRGLERANRRATRFLVHDFKTPLGTILGFTDILLSRDRPLSNERDTDALTRIRRQGVRMLDAVGTLLDLSRMRGRASLNRTALQVNRLLVDAKDTRVWGLPASRVEVGRRASTCPKIDADAQIVRRVLGNLVSNALKHNAGGTRVLLDACPAQDGSDVEFTCTDDGRGISEEFVPRLFVESATDGDGTPIDSVGLGLAFCREAVEAHGGRIWYERPAGSGARFCFTLPVAKEGDRCSVAN